MEIPDFQREASILQDAIRNAAARYSKEIGSEETQTKDIKVNTSGDHI